MLVALVIYCRVREHGIQSTYAAKWCDRVEDATDTKFRHELCKTISKPLLSKGWQQR